LSTAVAPAARRRPRSARLRPAAESFRITALGTSGDWAGQEAGIAIRPLGRDWLVSGRLLDDWERAQRTIERALLLAVLLSLMLGVCGGLVLTRYVTPPAERIAGAVDAVAAGDLTRRGSVPRRWRRRLRSARAPHRRHARPDRRLMAELRVVTDSIAHDLRSPIARLRARAEAAC
jgi:signal transduction histidine kinase